MKALFPFLALALLAPALSFAADHKINMLNAGSDGLPMAFEPSLVKAEPGDTVTFVPKDKGAHNSASIFLPQGAKPWKSKPDETFTVKLEREGVYLYACEPHKAMGMAGAIQVGKAANLDEAKKFAQAASEQMAAGKNRLPKALEQAK